MKKLSALLALSALTITSIAQGDAALVGAVDPIQPVFDSGSAWLFGTPSPGSLALLGVAALVGARRRR